MPAEPGPGIDGLRTFPSATLGTDRHASGAVPALSGAAHPWPPRVAPVLLVTAILTNACSPAAPVRRPDTGPVFTYACSTRRNDGRGTVAAIGDGIAVANSSFHPVEDRSTLVAIERGRGSHTIPVSIRIMVPRQVKTTHDHSGLLVSIAGMDFFTDPRRCTPCPACLDVHHQEKSG